MSYLFSFTSLETFKKIVLFSDLYPWVDSYHNNSQLQTGIKYFLFWEVVSATSQWGTFETN